MIRKLSPTAILLCGFLAIILLGTVLLMLPISSAERVWTDPLTAFFTATSATCVTGLVVVNTAVYWSWFGKAMLLLMIQIGGLGFMSVAMLFSQLLRRRVSPKERLIFMQSMNLPDVSDLSRFLKRMYGTVIAAEMGGALLLCALWTEEFGFGKALRYGIFHSVSAFCNAGFDVFGDGMIRFSGNTAVLCVLSVLIIAGGLGFTVWSELLHAIVKREKLSLYARLVLFTSAALLLFGTIVFLVSEWGNPDTIGDMSFGGKLQNSFFQSVSMRTAGFASVAQKKLHPLSMMICMFLMFIGGSSGSTAGGVKTVTFSILLVAALQIFKGKREISFRKRRILQNTVDRAFALIFFGGVTVFVSTLVLSLTESFPLGALAFEVFSAFGTVGVTTGITADFSVFGKLWLMLLMFLGRLGMISVAYTLLLGSEGKTSSIRYPKADLPIG